MVLEPGQHLEERYRIDRLIATGGTGSVYKATDEKLKRLVAIKLFPTRAESYVREAEVAGSLVHRNIVSLYDFVESDHFCFLVMEYVDGETLAELLDRCAYLSIEEALRVGIELTHALGYAHQRGILHCDLNPSNVMVGFDGEVKLMDFGMALRSGIPLEGSSEFGTLAYMSPERLAGAVGDSRSDQYALGVLLYRMLAGDVPFRGRTNLAMAHQIIAVVPKPLREGRADVSRRLEDTVMRLLAKDPDERFGDMAEVRLHLRRSLQSSRLPFDLLQDQLDLPSVETLPALQEVREFFDQIRAAGQGGILLLTGGLGAAKLALLDYVQKQAPQMGFRVLQGQAEANAQDYPYYLVRKTLQSYLAGAGLETSRQLLGQHLDDARQLPFLLNLAGFSFETQQTYQYLGMEESLLRDSVYRALQEWLCGQCREQPVVLMLKELQWIDHESLNLLIDLLELCREHPILFLCSYRFAQESCCERLVETVRTRYPDRFRQLQVRHLTWSEAERSVIRYRYVPPLRRRQVKRLDFRQDAWEFYENDGTIQIEADGSLVLKVPVLTEVPCTFPFVCTVNDPFPEGDFAVRLEMQYLDSRQNGAGFEVCVLRPRNQSDPLPGYQSVLNIWQDHSSSRHLFCCVNGRWQVFLSESPDLNTHRYELRFSKAPDGDHHLFFFFDGRLVGGAWGVPRPDTLWFGQFKPDRTSLGWSDLRVHWIDVIAS